MTTMSSFKRTLASECVEKVGTTVSVKGWVKRIRRLGNVSFLVIGEVVSTTKTNSGVEILAQQVNELHSSETPPIELNKKELTASLETVLNHRVLSMRHEKISAIFKIKATLSQAFTDYLTQEGFTQIFTPKVVSQSAEGGANVLTFDYFGKEAYLAQSPQFYKQIMVAAGYERVFEVGHVYRAEEHNSSRYLNEYVSLDIEMVFIESFEELMALETNVLTFMFKKVKERHAKELELLNVEIPEITNIPKLTVEEARSVLKEKYKKEMPKDDINAEGEKLIAKYCRETFGSEFVFLTHYPKESRPMYTMPAENGLTKSFNTRRYSNPLTKKGSRRNVRKLP